jgi:hypothetical protein
MEDYKEGDYQHYGGDNESLMVPEEIEEELPLRIRTLQFDLEEDDNGG